MIDVLLVTPPGRAKIYQKLGEELAAIEPPVFAMLSAEFLRRRGLAVAILDADASGLSLAETAAAIEDADPLLTVFVIYGQQPSASTQCMPAGRAVAELLDEDRATLAIGTHPSALPARTLREEPYRFVCQGEGPLTIWGLVQRLRSGDTDFRAVPGLWYRDGENVASNPPAAKLESLDVTLPGQSWDLVDLRNYRAHNWHCFDDLGSRRPYASIATSLGCPYRCSFCCINAPFGSAGVRFWSPEHVVGQIDRLVEEYGIRNIKIPDEMFVLNERHVLGICDLLIERAYDLNIWAYARIDTIRPRFLEKLARAGFRWLAIGVESASAHVRDGVRKGPFGRSEIEHVVRSVREAGISVVANYIFGLPDDDLSSMRETLELARSLNTEWANFYCAMAYPGSPLYAQALESGLPLPADWIGYSQHAPDTLPLPAKRLTGHEVLAFRDHAFQTYFTDGAYLGMIERRFGRSVVDHVRRMTSYRLPRNIPAGSGSSTRRPIETPGAF